MEEKTTKTSDALLTFIQSQQKLLAQTKAEVERLKRLRHEIAGQPADLSVDGLLEQLQESGRNRQNDIAPSLPVDLSWDSFSLCDPAPFRSLASASRLAHERRKYPSTRQCSPLSPLQQLVKDSRVSILDPILNSFSPLSSDEEEEPPDPEELKRVREREKIRDLKKRRIDGESAIHMYAGLGLRRVSTASGVFIRRDQEDESAEVDIDLAAPRDVVNGDGTAHVVGSSSEPGTLMDVDTPPTSVASPSSAKSALPPPAALPISKPSRSRRPTRKAVAAAELPPAPPPKIELPATGEQAREEEVPKVGKNGKPRPETYKQAWSVSEQHLLERLLEEIPEGEKNRWLKISQAMNGRRTARQVASRVQKYYEKLKRFGLDVGRKAGRENES